MVLAIVLFLIILLAISKVCVSRDPEGEEWDYYKSLYKKGVITKREFNQSTSFILMKRSIRIF